MSSLIATASPVLAEGPQLLDLRLELGDRLFEIEIAAHRPVKTMKNRRRPAGPAGSRTLANRARQVKAAGPQAATPSLRCRLVEDVVYWKTSFFSGYT